jgi:ubiquitin C-terminal hydrolase
MNNSEQSSIPNDSTQNQKETSPLEVNTPQTPHHTFIDEIFQGYFESVVTCLRCNKQSVTKEEFLHFSVEIPPKFRPIPKALGKGKKKNGTTQTQFNSTHTEEICLKLDLREQVRFTSFFFFFFFFKKKLCVRNFSHFLLEVDLQSIDSNNLSLLSCIRWFTDPELLDGDDCFSCGTCYDEVGGTPGLKQFVLSELPPILCITIKRFTAFSKIDLAVPFAEILDLSPFVKPSARTESTTSCLYELYGCVVHSGGLRGGHYIAYTKAYSPEGSRSKWYYSSDSYVKFCELKQVLLSNAYLLFYERKIVA